MPPAPPRRFPAPWTAERIPGGYVVRDANGQTIAWVYARENEAVAGQAKVLTFDEARRGATNIARLPELLGRSGTNERAANVETERRRATASPTSAIL